MDYHIKNWEKTGRARMSLGTRDRMNGAEQIGVAKGARIFLRTWAGGPEIA